MEKSVVLFDGVCNLCNGAVQFIIARDPDEKFRFASLQSDFATNALIDRSDLQQDLSSFVLLENGQLYTQSTAALRVAKKLSGIWPILYGLILIPAFFRDAVYKWIAKNRYRWFGKKDQCMIPSPALKQRFLD